jgi:ATP-dependent DNA helicase DinG
MDDYTSQDILGEDGYLKKYIPQFQTRTAQLDMANAIEATIQQHKQLIVEAGTGTGKTFGYLVPAFLSQKKTIISTGTKNLQDQLFYKDIPIIKRIFKKLFSIAPKVEVLKGRANYICLHRIKVNREDGRFLLRHTISELEQIHEWSAMTKTGDHSELDSIAEDSPVWPYATSTVENCLNQECDFYKNCFVMKARQKSLKADVVIVNHHLFFADMVLQKDGFGELLPGADTIIFDEAHHLPDVASLFFSVSLTSKQFTYFIQDCNTSIKLHANDMLKILEETDYLQKSLLDFKSALDQSVRSAPWPKRLSQPLENAISDIKLSLKNVAAILKTLAVRHKEIENNYHRVIKLSELFTKILATSDSDAVHWYEIFLQGFAIHLTPVGVAEHFKKFLSLKDRSWIFTSATLTVDNTFSLFVDTLGLQKAGLLQLMSPFDFKNQTLLYVPRGMPDPNDRLYLDAMMAAVIPVLNAASGRTFILFTSHRALDFADTYLKDKISFPILRQGTKPKQQLIESFKSLGNAVLLGTSSFWQGVDVRGDALSCVIIDKLPFSNPDDPILQAKIQSMRDNNLDPFMQYQLPKAVLVLKQGVGRLIRDVSDRGVLMICDPRLVSNRYGDIFLKSLPAMAKTREFQKVRAFFDVAVSAE